MSPSGIIPRSAVSPMMLAIWVSMGDTSVVACPPPVRDTSRLWAVTRFLALTFMSNRFFFISESALSSDPTELTAAVTFSHADFFLLLVYWKFCN